uniref:RagB/SusD family nutrient uptake outer membrane protein n=1 Tax=Prevotella sp. GTC17259 TaxID=3236795 RepID=A0AB33J2L3_9BACT
MKRIYLINTLFTALLALATTGCTDLVPVDSSEINTSNFPSTEADIESRVMSCYYPLRGNWWDGIFTPSERGVMFVNDCTTGILTGNFGVQKMASELNFYPESEEITWFYYKRDEPNGYANKVSRCTLVLDEIEHSTIDEKAKAKYMAEVKCARAFLSYVLYDMYGPLVVPPLEVLKNPLDEKPLPRLERAEMVKFIEDDLKFAADNLPVNPEYGRFSSGLAHMLLIRLYLHETAVDKSYFAKVETEARELMKAKYGYGLQADYNKMFELGGQGQGNKEIIYAIPCSYDGPNYNQWHMMVLPTDFQQNGMSGGWGTVTSTWYFYQSFEANDVRRAKLLTSYTNSAGETVDKDTPQSPLAAGPIALKIGYDPKVSGSGGYSDIDLILFRYADVYLSLAEALCQKTGATAADLKEAASYVNVIRNRAGLGNLKSEDYATSDKLLDAILNERWHEFWCENGQFRADLIRYHRLIPLVKKINQSPYAENYKELYPLPLSVISDGKGEVKQNPNY